MQKKYELTGETIKHRGRTLYRIRALKDLPMRCVKKGDLGGWIETESNLSQKGDAWVSGNAKVYDDAEVFEGAWVCGGAEVFGDAWVSEGAWVYDGAEVFGDAWVYGDTKVFDGAKVFGGCHGGHTKLGINAYVSKNEHCLTIRPVASENCNLTMYRTVTGGHYLNIGCWEGDLDDLAELIKSDTWPSGCNEHTRERYRPQLEKVHTLCEWRANQWAKETKHLDQ